MQKSTAVVACGCWFSYWVNIGFNHTEHSSSGVGELSPGEGNLYRKKQALPCAVPRQRNYTTLFSTASEQDHVARFPGRGSCSVLMSKVGSL